MSSTMFDQLPFCALPLSVPLCFTLTVFRPFAERVLRLNHLRFLALSQTPYCLQLRPIRLLLVP